MSNRNPRFLSGLLCVVFSLVFSLPVLAQSKEEKKRIKEMQDALEREARPVVLLVNYLQKEQGAGEPHAYMVNPREGDPDKAFTDDTPAVDPATVVWRNDLMKASDGKVYVPYTITVPADALPSGPLSLYARVVTKGAPPPSATVRAPLSGTVTAKKEEPFPFEDFFTSEARLAPGQPLRLMRAFAVEPGEYDVYIGIRPKLADPKKGRDNPVRVIALKRTVTLPDFWSGDFATSTIVVTAKVEQVSGKVSPEVQRERPYLFGQTEFLPSSDNRFSKADDISVVFQIYNPTMADGGPNVTIEYTFHVKSPEGEKYFNKTSPQQLNAQTLPPNFDVTATQMLPGGQSVPLASFPPGDYRMEIKITDVNAKQTITRDVMFTVLGA